MTLELKGIKRTDIANSKVASRLRLKNTSYVETSCMGTKIKFKKNIQIETNSCQLEIRMMSQNIHNKCFLPVFLLLTNIEMKKEVNW